MKTNANNASKRAGASAAHAQLPPGLAQRRSAAAIRT